MIYNFNCKLKGIDFKYKIEADNIEDAKIRVRNYIKNAVEIEWIVPKETPNDFINFFNDIVNSKQ